VGVAVGVDVGVGVGVGVRTNSQLAPENPVAQVQLNN
jgi:hypothetical protein